LPAIKLHQVHLVFVNKLLVSYIFVDFSWSSEQIALREHARRVANEAVKKYGRFNDTWMNGYSREFSRELAEHG